MSWHIAPALKQMLAEVNKKWPNRSRLSDGGIGNAEHSSRSSDHNPNGRRSVNAFDVTIAGIDEGTLIAQAKKHPSVRYIIFNRRIMNRDIGNFAARRYSGPNPHNKHVHISLYQSATAERRTQSWGLADAKAVGGVSGGGSSPDYKQIGYGDMVKLYTKGAPVRDVQTVVGVKVDGFAGPSTIAAVKKWQKKNKLTADGIIGPKSWKKIKKQLKKKPVRKKNKAPKFPLRKGHWYGTESSNKKNHSGYHAGDRKGIRTFQQKLKDRGWNISVDGRFGADTNNIVRQFQAERGLAADSLVGANTWKAIWESPLI